MRPEVQRQQPHHFIRRWPRARRDKRGPSEFTLELAAKVSRLDMAMAIGMGKEPTNHDIKYLAGKSLRSEVDKYLKPGWGTELINVATDPNYLSGGVDVRATVRFYRM